MNSTVTLSSGVVLTLAVQNGVAMMSGGKFGTHTVEGDEARITAHWRGYVENNGGKLPSPVSVVAQQPVYVQLMARQFDVRCTPRHTSQANRPFTVRVLAWNKADANKIVRKSYEDAMYFGRWDLKATPVPGLD